MHLSSEQVLALAPDAGSAAAGKKLANTRHWRNLGQNAEAAWGECQGSALYQVRVELATFAVKCTCPSHKFPCKHGLGLLLLATNATDVPTADASRLGHAVALEARDKRRIGAPTRTAGEGG